MFNGVTQMGHRQVQMATGTQNPEDVASIGQRARQGLRGHDRLEGLPANHHCPECGLLCDDKILMCHSATVQQDWLRKRLLNLPRLIVQGVNVGVIFSFDRTP